MKRKVLLALFALCMMYSALPSTVDCLAGESPGSKIISVNADTAAIGKTAGEYRLFDIIPLKTVEVNVKPRKELVPCGNAIGIKIETEGVMVIGTSEVYGEGSPGADAGLLEGDVILGVNGSCINSTSELREAVSNCGGNKIDFEVRRGEKTKNISIEPAKNPLDGSYYIGAWVRDSTAGIGTMTWFDPETGEYGALGHSITDVDTGEIMDVSKGEIVQAEIVGSEKGNEGAPGLLIGNFLEREGTISENSKYGINGFVEKTWLLPEKEAIEVSAPSEVEEGDAEILCCIEGTEPQSYNVKIEKVMTGKMWGEKNMVIRIDDDRLLSQTGGIVQGMSGSPIVQNGKLVGAVTHVFVNDPTRGYGIFIENMLAEVEKIK